MFRIYEQMIKKYIFFYFDPLRTPSELLFFSRRCFNRFFPYASSRENAFFIPQLAS